VQQTGSILIIDQEPAIVDVLGEILTDAGYIAYTVLDGADALVAITQHPPVLILLDVGRRGMRGAALIEYVRAVGLTTMPIVVLTTAPHDIASLLAPGVVECLAKPFTIDALLACVARYVQPLAAVSASRARRIPAIALT
jgi:CheY-like chemotaxis protein